MLASVVLLWAAHWYSRDAVALLLPALSKALSFVADDFKILRFEFVEERGNAAIAALATLEHTLVLGGRAIVPNGTSVMVVTTTVGTVLQPVLVALVLVLAWPARWLEAMLRVVFVAPLIALVVLLDTPFSMAAWLWEIQLRAYEPGRASPLVWWNIFLNGGGRLALGLLAGASSVVLAQAVTGRLARPERADPP
jgi:hypothetical protein